LITDMCKALLALTRIHAQAAFALLVHCFQARPVYLSRVSEPNLYGSAMATFDERVDEAVAALARTASTPVVKALRRLPQRMGGLGLTPMVGAKSEKGCLEARGNTRRFIEQYHGQSLQSGMDCWLHFRIGERDYARYRADDMMDEGAADESHHRLSPDELAALVSYKDQWEQIYNHLRTHGHAHQAAWLLSSTCSGAGKFLTWRGGSDGRFLMDSHNFEECLRLRLLVDCFPDAEGMRCQTCDVTLGDDPLHPLNCEGLKVQRAKRHDRLRDAFAQLLRMCYPDAEVSTEKVVDGLPRIGGADDGTGRCRVRADVYMRDGPTVTIFDVAIVNPSARSYIEKGSDESPDVAARHREELKRQAFYERFGTDTQILFVPFVVEATGRMGPAAVAYYDRYIAANTETWKGQQFLAKMSSIVALWNSRMILDTRVMLGAGHRLERHPANEWRRA